MAYLTDRKRAEGMGSSKTGTKHHWHTIVSACALAGLIPLFIFTFGPMLGEPHDVVLAHFSRPFPAIIAGLTIFATMLHFKDGVRVMIEDYVHGTWRRITIIIMVCLSYMLAATGLFAIARIAL